MGQPKKPMSRDKVTRSRNPLFSRKQWKNRITVAFTPRGFLATRPQDQRRRELPFPQYEQIQMRVGREPRERLAWALVFAQRDLGSLTPGDWENIRWELWSFTLTPWWKLAEAGWGQGRIYEAYDFPEQADVISAQTKFGETLADLQHKGFSMIGPVAEILIVPWSRTEKGQTLRVALEELTPGEFPPPDSLYCPLSEFSIYAESRFGLLIGQFGEYLQICPEEDCGRWFVANRSNQDYCSSRCQMRAATNRYRQKRKKRKKKR